MPKRNIYAAVLQAAIKDLSFRTEILSLDNDYFPPEYIPVFEAMKQVEDFSDVGIKEQMESLGHDSTIVDDIMSQEESTSKVSDLAFIIEQKNKKDFYFSLKDILKDVNKTKYSELVDKARSALSVMPSGKITSETSETVANELINDIVSYKKGDKKPYLSTGLLNFDEKIKMTKNKYVLLSSQRKIGKTKFTINVSYRLMKYNKNVNVLYISLEMTRKEIATGYISLISGISEEEILSTKNTLTEDQFNQIKIASDEFSKLPFKIYDSPVGLKDLYAICMEFSRTIPENNIPIIIIDNIGLIKPDKKTAVEFEDEIARTLKDIRDDAGCLLIAIHHLNKSSENDSSNGYEPKIAHVRGSSRLLDFCNSLVLLHRPGFYEDLKEQAEKQEVDITNMFLVNIALQRGGSGGYVPMYCDLAKNKFREA